MEIRDQADTNVKFFSNAQQLQDLCEEIGEQSFHKLANRIVEQSNKRIAKVLRLDSVHIEHIFDGYIKYKDRGGTSMGQGLATVYSFLSSLFEDTKFDVPFVVDSPAHNMDTGVSLHVGRMIPKVFEQIVIFIIDREKAGFVDGLEDHSDKKIQYLTIDKVIRDGKPTGKINKEEGKEFFMEYVSMDKEN